MGLGAQAWRQSADNTLLRAVAAQATMLFPVNRGITFAKTCDYSDSIRHIVAAGCFS